MPESHLPSLRQALTAIGCPPDKIDEMARQLDKRALQLSEDHARTYDEAVLHLLKLMKQGWSARERGS